MGWGNRLETRGGAADRGHPGRPPARQAQGPARRGAAPSRSRSSGGDRNNSAGGGESNSGPGAGMTPPPRGAAGPAPAPPPSAFESGHPPPPLPPAATSCTNPLGPSCKSNAPSRPHATCAAANGYAVPPGLPAGPVSSRATVEQRGGLGSRSRPQTVLETVDHLCHRKPSGAQGGAQATNKRLRPPRRGNRDGDGRRPPRAAGFVRDSGVGTGPGHPRADPERLGPLGDARAATRSRLGVAARPRLCARRLSPARGGRAAKVGPGANQHLPTCRVGSCPGVPSPFPRRPRAPGHLLPVGGEPGCYLNARGS